MYVAAAAKTSPQVTPIITNALSAKTRRKLSNMYEIWRRPLLSFGRDSGSLRAILVRLMLPRIAKKMKTIFQSPNRNSCPPTRGAKSGPTPLIVRRVANLLGASAFVDTSLM